MEDFSF